MDEGKRDVIHSSRGRWKKTHQPKQPKCLSPVLMPASTLRSLQNLCSEKGQRAERETISTKKKKKKKKNPVFFKTNQKQTGPFQDHPTPPEGEALKS